MIMNKCTLAHQRDSTNKTTQWKYSCKCQRESLNIDLLLGWDGEIRERKYPAWFSILSRIDPMNQNKKKITPNTGPIREKNLNGTSAEDSDGTSAEDSEDADG